MKYDNIVPGIFRKRINRFVAIVEIDGKEESVHVKNTGRCRELLQDGVKASLQKCSNPSRKTRYDLIAVYREGCGWVNLDSQACNQVVREWLEAGNQQVSLETRGSRNQQVPSETRGFGAPFSLFPGISFLKPEYSYGRSRVDFYLECAERRILIEVKGCTLAIGGRGYFPDAPTERGVKHLQELVSAGKEGYESYVAFVIAIPASAGSIRMTGPTRNSEPHCEGPCRKE